jgi:hypothetical protein
VSQGDVPPVLGRTGPGGHPYVSLAFLGTVTLVLVLLANQSNIVALANVGALFAMIVVNAACFGLALRGWAGPGLRLPGGVLIPVLGVLTCLSQFPSLAWEMVLLGLALMVGGLVLFLNRHQRRLGEGLEIRARAAIARLETPLARALGGPRINLQAAHALGGAGAGGEATPPDEERRTGGP